ncbi:hypothetical protein Pan44_09690 [Caulifigura coniformis]|uniref:Uncharacterized protein n=1 Tax=Caulifigura coniformis TaxID=2527983 RepID=A0A517S9Y9_9PLAN|nr:hypothetical protein [Caulifigura coniformis]QDT52955.1 hypothetical protein Pan44_09690 [Caulifigura coniformis]
MSIRVERFLMLLAVGGLFALAASGRPATAFQSPKNQQWEYKSIIEISQNDIVVSDGGLLNQAGNVGWELVAVIDGPSPKAKQFVMKRPK